MFFDCNAAFVAYSLLSSFNAISHKEREAVRFALELIPCYDGLTGKLRMTYDAHVLAQIYLAQLRLMAARHCYTHDGSLEDAAVSYLIFIHWLVLLTVAPRAQQARALLSVIILPLVRHISCEEHADIVQSMGDAEALLACPLERLNELVNSWKLRNLELIRNWRSYPIDGVEYYHFGVELPSKFRLEDLLTPLPYLANSLPIILPGESFKITHGDAQFENKNKGRKLFKFLLNKQLGYRLFSRTCKHGPEPPHFVFSRPVSERATLDSDSDSCRDSFTTTDSCPLIDHTSRDSELGKSGFKAKSRIRPIYIGSKKSTNYEFDTPLRSNVSCYFRTLLKRD
ncbi:hypothetical protein CTheo_3804 [Ceratobasidium theobromae]|uniref:Uncharacterized protein n=1 Tax=Ceratobasidium theobromae TaxID=1582974 RepID=A0A5N5QNL7_9AGAM|nr:hypothetical protein CTheo_3804 [Ceratobasidium theobromae]